MILQNFQIFCSSLLLSLGKKIKKLVLSQLTVNEYGISVQCRSKTTNNNLRWCIYKLCWFISREEHIRKKFYCIVQHDAIQKRYKEKEKNCKTNWVVFFFAHNHISKLEIGFSEPKKGQCKLWNVSIVIIKLCARVLV